MTQIDRENVALKRLRAAGRSSDGWAVAAQIIAPRELRALVEKGFVEEKPGQFPTYRLSPKGHARLMDAARAPLQTK